MSFTVISGTKENLQVKRCSGSYSPKKRAELVSQFGKDLVIIDESDEDWPIHIGDARKTSALYRRWLRW